MANSLNSLTTTYAGEFAGKYLSAALLSANTIDKGGIEVKPNIKYKSVMKKVATGAIIANASCDFTKTDDAVTITERILQPEEFQVNLEFCKKDLIKISMHISYQKCIWESLKRQNHGK